MGEDTCIYVKKADLMRIGFWTALEAHSLFGNRWHFFKDKFLIDSYDEQQFYWTAKEVVYNIAGKKIDEKYVSFIKRLSDFDSIIMGDYSDFPKDKEEDDYIDLTSLFYGLWDEMLEKNK